MAGMPDTEKIETPILVVGLSAAGAKQLPASLLTRLKQADLLVGGQRQLDYFPDFTQETIAIGANIPTVVERLKQAIASQHQAVVLASGDPLCYGMGATLRRYFPAHQLEIIPTPTAFQLAFAALAEPWHDALLLSAHGRSVADVVTQLVSPHKDSPQEGLTASKAAILTDNQHTPAVIAQALLEQGMSPHSPCAICENLGSTEQRVVPTRLGEVDQQSYAPLNVFVVWAGGDWGAGDKGIEGLEIGDKGIEGLGIGDKGIGGLGIGDKGIENSALIPQSPNLQSSISQSKIQNPKSKIHPLPDDVFSTSAGQITKREIRLLSLAELALQPHQIMWDIGAGSGAVAIEAGRSQPSGRVYAIEKRTEMYRHIQENLTRFPTPNVQLTQGIAPADLFDWPQPHAVFIGGSGGNLSAIITLATEQLHPYGRLVINLATLDNLHTVQQQLPTATITQIQINRGVSVLDMTRFQALNPVFMITWRKE